MNLIRLGYSGTTLAPGRNDSGVSDYSASHNLLRAHAKVYRYYESVYKSSQQGKIIPRLQRYHAQLGG